MKILRRPRSTQETDALIEEVNQSKFIGHFSQEDLENLIDADTIRFFYDDEDDELVGFGAWEEIDQEWIEVGPLFTRRKFRGKGAGRLIFNTVLELNRRRHLFAVTKNDIITHMFTRHGFTTVGLSRLPRAILWHQVRRLTLRRLWNLLTKFRFEPVIYLVRPRKDERQPHQDD